MTDAKERARSRALWPIRRLSLEQEGSDDQAARTTPREGLAMMWRLALDAWASSGQRLPEYDRKQAPGRVLRTKGSDQRP